MTRRIKAVHLGSVPGLVVLALGLSACSGGGSWTAGYAPAPFPHLATPLATSIVTAQGTWATIPMGHLDDPKNTFWQLFFRPAQGGSWVNQVAATATATNGGLVLADRAGHQLAVGVLPSQFLHFTPIVASSDAGTSWSDGLLDGAMGSSPSALALSPDGDALAIRSSAGAGPTVMMDSGGLSSWTPLVTARAITETPTGRTCSPGAFTAVAYVGGAALLGVACTRRGGAGIFAADGARWRAVGPVAPSSVRQGRAQVLGFVAGGGGVAALVGYGTAQSSDVVATWTSDGRSWEPAPPLVLPTDARVLSYGGTGGRGLFVLLGVSGGQKQLEAIAGPGSTWSVLPSPPPTTETVAADGHGGLTALAVHDTVLTTWSLGPADGWQKGQRLTVDIQFGSSS